ncbi:hypothetical protein [Streptomyces sp. CB02923]|uniref:hypothetical protein n=1 Tax=Streptomyces sp. CB02923 TaxID=1718985 RepID=UPI00267E2488
MAGRGSARAARIQAETVACAQRAARLRESRRTAYLDLIEQTHRLGEFHWVVLAVLRNNSGTGSGTGSSDGH